MAKIFLYDMEKQPNPRDTPPNWVFYANFETTGVALRPIMNKDSAVYFGCEVLLPNVGHTLFFSSISVLDMQSLIAKAEKGEAETLWRKKHPLLSWVREWFYKMFVAAIGPAERP